MRKLLAFLLLSTALYGQNFARMLSGVNYQVGTTYTFQATDVTKVVSFSNGSAVAVTLPNGVTSGFGIGSIFTVKNTGAGTVTITCSSCLISGSSTLALTTGQGGDIYSDGAGNYVAQIGAGSGGGGTNPGGSNLQVQFNDSGVFGGVAGLTFNKATNALSVGGALSAQGVVTAIAGLTVSSISGSTQCLHVNSSGMVSGTGSDCSAGGTSAWSALTNPSGNQALNMGNFSTTWTGGTNTPNPAILWQDTAGNLGTLFAQIITHGAATNGLSITTPATAIPLTLDAASTSGVALSIPLGHGTVKFNTLTSTSQNPATTGSLRLGGTDAWYVRNQQTFTGTDYLGDVCAPCAANTVNWHVLSKNASDIVDVGDAKGISIFGPMVSNPVAGGGYLVHSVGGVIPTSFGSEGACGIDVNHQWSCSVSGGTPAEMIPRGDVHAFTDFSDITVGTPSAGVSNQAPVTGSNGTLDQSFLPCMGTNNQNSTPYNVAASDYCLTVVNSNAGAATFNLPAQPSPRWFVKFKNDGSNTLTIARCSGCTINGAASNIVMPSSPKFQSITCTADSIVATNYECDPPIKAGTGINISGTGGVMTVTTARGQPYPGNCQGQVTAGLSTVDVLLPWKKGSTLACADTSVQEAPMTSPCTVVALYASAGTSGSDANSGIVTVFKNNVATTSTCTLGTSSPSACNDTTHNPTFVAGDLYSIRVKTGSTTNPDLLADVRASFECQ